MDHHLLKSCELHDQDDGEGHWKLKDGKDLSGRTVLVAGRQDFY